MNRNSLLLPPVQREVVRRYFCGCEQQKEHENQIPNQAQDTDQ